MDFRFSAEDVAFQREVRAFVRENLPPAIRYKVEHGKHVSREDTVAWQKILYKRGWAAPSWPVEYGGTGWSLVRRYLFNRELDLNAAPTFAPFGLNLVGPVIYTFGSEAQKRRYLPPILSGDELWCQGFSEPGAGSDLASLRTRAEDRGDHYIVNGQKIWTSKAHHADMIFCLVRTSTARKKQEGISFLLIDIRSPGITIRPIVSIDGAHSLNEVFFEDVRVPKENLVGEEGKGWTYAKFLLGRERTSISGVGRSWRQLRRLKRIAAETSLNGRRLIDDPDFSRALAELEVELTALEYSELRVLAAEIAGKPIGWHASMLKVTGSELQQKFTSLLLQTLGDQAALFVDDADFAASMLLPDHADGALSDHLYSRATTIYGGTNEIQRNIIAQTVLG